MTYQPTFNGIEPRASYPETPGSKGTDGTSQEAAESMKGIAGRLRRIAMETFGQLGEATALECVEYSGFSVDSIRPRVSELRAMRLLEPTGERRRNPSGKSAAVLRLTDAGRIALHG